MKDIKFSVAMSIYKNDNPDQLVIALNSICTQSYVPDEVFLVIDGPVPDSLETVIKEFSKKYNFFTIERLATNHGLGYALSVAMEKCRNDLIFRMDSDDISAPSRFEKQLNYYSMNPVDVLGTWTLGFFGDLHYGSVSEFTPPIEDSDIKKAMKHTTAVSHVTVLLNRKSVLKSGNYKDLFYHEDYYLWVRMIKNGCKFANIPEHLVYVRCGEEQAKRHGGKKYYLAEKQLRQYMLKNKLITKMEYRKEMFLRFIYQRLMGPSIRCFIDKKIKRKYLNRDKADKIIGAALDE